MTETPLLDRALSRLDEATRHISIDSDVIEKLKYPRETIKMRLLIRMDLPAGSVRRARRRGEQIFSQVWYDAFGEREPGHEGRVIGLGA